MSSGALEEQMHHSHMAPYQIHSDLQCGLGGVRKLGVEEGRQWDRHPHMASQPPHINSAPPTPPTTPPTLHHHLYNGAGGEISSPAYYPCNFNCPSTPPCTVD
jgi:hypothetical protein